MPRPPKSASPADEHRPEWFEQFLADRGTRKPSAHTLKAYRQDFDAIAALLAGDRRATADLLIGWFGSSVSSMSAVCTARFFCSLRSAL